jgi:copper chaperone CopZ
VEIRVKIDCEGCKQTVKKAVEGMKGVKDVQVDPKEHKVTVVGYVDPGKVVSRMKHRTGKKAEIWPYVPYNLVDHPYALEVYDRKAPAGYVRNVQDPQLAYLTRASSTEVWWTTAFNEENPTACTIM